GCGTVAKLVHNMVSACSRMAIAEGMTLGVKAGVAPEVLLDALSKSSFGQMRVLKDMIPNTVFPGAYDDVNFALKLLRKDVGLATELGREYHVPMMIAAIAEQQLEEALRRGWGDGAGGHRIRLHRGPAVASRRLLLFRRHPPEPPAPADAGQGARARAGEHRRGQRHHVRPAGPPGHLRGR
ncbi:MAG: hypothetical protein DME03_00165, partial [Candidatus Rokuibacteriota bacterium]